LGEEAKNGSGTLPAYKKITPEELDKYSIPATVQKYFGPRGLLIVLTSGEKARVGRKCYDAPKPGETPDVPAQIVPKTRKFKRTRWHDIVSDVFKDSQYASRTFKDKMLVAKRLYAQEKREGSAADRTRVDREETQVRSKEQRATLSRAGSMRRSPPRQMNFNSGRR
jgi:hypothetical protein